MLPACAPLQACIYAACLRIYAACLRVYAACLRVPLQARIYALGLPRSVEVRHEYHKRQG